MEAAAGVTESIVSNATGKIAFPVEEKIRLFANKFSSDIRVPLVIWLEGDLGSGKTTW
jgi:tRNA A37 threonylcarbamoyladenosine biosynthesis protein TsaE